MQGTWEMYMYSKKTSKVIGLGDNTTLFDFTFVDNVAWAHVLAGENADHHNGIAGQVNYTHSTNVELGFQHY